MEAASSGPIVIFNTTAVRSDAIVTVSQIKVINLPDLTYAELSKNVQVMIGSNKKDKNGLVQGTLNTLHAGNSRMKDIMLWLWDVAVEPVLEVVRLIRLPSSSNLDVLPQV